MKHDELDRILSAEEELFPSSGFADSVMQAIRSEASAPRPIPFPWTRALPGLAAVVTTLVVLAVVIVLRPGLGSAVPENAAKESSVVRPVVGAAMNAGAHWIVAALLVTLASVSVSMRVGSRNV